MKLSESADQKSLWKAAQVMQVASSAACIRMQLRAGLRSFKL